MARPRPFHWLHTHPRGADWLLAAVLCAGGVIAHFFPTTDNSTHASVLGVVLSVAATLPVAARRHQPLAVLVAVLAAQMWLEVMNAPGPGWVGVLVATYSLGAYRRGRELFVAGAMFGAIALSFVVLGLVRGDAPWHAVISTPIFYSSAVALGDNMRRRRQRAAELLERAERAERERDLLASQRVQHERTRIARELHDAVAHSVSVMIIQAGAARRRVSIDPAAAAEAMTTIEVTGRQAMTEMRRILGVLRDDGETDLHPQPSLDSLPSLIAVDPELPLVFRTEGDLNGLPVGMELSAYRVVQEALTNVRRHAGVVHQVEVHVARATDALTVEVVDDGRGASVQRSDEGYGLVGMRERVGAFDGQLFTGPRQGGGWRVTARFPLASA